MRIALLTAGGAGMFCGSCMHDNTLARAIIAAGHECYLVPCYSPIRVDEDNFSDARVFMGGVNLYLDHKLPWWGRVPSFVRGWLDRPGVLKLMTRFGSRSDAAQLGDLTLAMLRGMDGPLRTEIPPLTEYLVSDLRPDVIVFSNALLAGVLPSLRAAYDGPIACLLQGDDVFLDGLPSAQKQQAVDATARLAERFDALLTHTTYYADYMQTYFGLNERLFRQVPLGIDTSEYDAVPPLEERTGSDVTLGYFARQAPEKGLHLIAEAFVALHDEHPVRLVVGGFEHPKDAAYIADVRRQLDGRRWHHAGSPNTVEEKAAFYASVDAFSVPATFVEPKGLSILEALAAGRPVVQPRHGAYPEIIAATGGGLLVEPHDATSLQDGLRTLTVDAEQRFELGRRGREAVRERFGMAAMARETLAVLEEFVGGRAALRVAPSDHPAESS